ncbi:MAG: three-Cys-motif partner protein TcmP [Chloroflexota bacterium]
MDGDEQLGFGFEGGSLSVPVGRVRPRRRRHRSARDRQLGDHPQTRLKLRAYASYLPAWLRVMGKQDQDVFVLDLFAGPGRYPASDPRGDAGSPVIACLAALVFEERQRAAGSAITIHLRFAERSRATFNALQDALAPFEDRLNIQAIRGTAADVASRFADESRGHPTLVFLDPDGFKDVPFTMVQLFSGRKYTELLISFDVQGYIRAAGIDAGSISAFRGNDMWRQERIADEAIDVDRFLEGYRSDLAGPGMFPYTTIKRLVFGEAHANRAIVQACGSQVGVKIWRESFVAAFEADPGVQVLDIVKQLDRRERIDRAVVALASLAGSAGLSYGAVAQFVGGLDLPEADLHQVLLFLREYGCADWSSRLHRDARPRPRFDFSGFPAGLRWDGVERPGELPALRVARTTA